MFSSCRLCSEPQLNLVYSFNPNPYGDLFCDSVETARDVPVHPIALARCSACGLLQLFETTDLDSQYIDYLYFTATTNNLALYYREVAESFTSSSELSLTKDTLIVDIGSNDGSFLKHFADLGYGVLGVDPSRPACEIANKIGIETISGYLSQSLVDLILSRNRKIGLISINYTLANVPDLHGFVSLIKQLVSEQTIVSIITGYHPDQFAVNMFDYIGHDHLTYLTLHDFLNVAKIANLKILKIERVEHKGGSIQVLLAHENSLFKESPSVWQVKQREEWLQVSSNASILRMMSNVARSQFEVQRELTDSQERQTLAAGIGASISTSYFCTQFLLHEKISEIYDDDPRKIGRFAPKSGLPVYALSEVGIRLPPTLVILAWQHTSKLLSRLREVDYKGRVIVPLPEMTVTRF